jgi:hypothetical protein
MKMSKKMSPFGLLTILIIGVIATSTVAVIVLSNVVIVQNHVSDEKKINLSLVDLDYDSDKPYNGYNGAYTNWNEEVVLNITYDLGIQITSSMDLSNIIIKFTILGDYNTDIDSLNLEYWTGVTFANLGTKYNESTQTFSGSIGLINGFPVTEGYNETIPITIIYNEIGNYTITMWIEYLEPKV